MKAFLLMFLISGILTTQGYSQSKVTFAAPATYKLKIVIENQTQEDDQYVRFENIKAGNYTAQITATVGGEAYNLRSTISLPDNRETSYFIIVVNKTAQIHWTNETAIATSQIAAQESYPKESLYNKDRNLPARPNQEYDYRQSERDGYRNQPRQPAYTPTCESANPYPVLNREDATRLKVAVQHTAFDRDKLAMIQTALSRANIMSTDVMDLMRLLAFDNNRLQLAKQAYSRTCDKQNYYRVSSALDFPSNSRELQRYLQYVQ